MSGHCSEHLVAGWGLACCLAGPPPLLHLPVEACQPRSDVTWDKLLWGQSMWKSVHPSMYCFILGMSWSRTRITCSCFPSTSATLYLASAASFSALFASLSCSVPAYRHYMRCFCDHLMEEDHESKVLKALFSIATIHTLACYLSCSLFVLPRPMILPSTWKLIF